MCALCVCVCVCVCVWFVCVCAYVCVCVYAWCVCMRGVCMVCVCMCVCVVYVCVVCVCVCGVCVCVQLDMSQLLAQPVVVVEESSNITAILTLLLRSLGFSYLLYLNTHSLPQIPWFFLPFVPRYSLSSSSDLLVFLTFCTSVLSLLYRSCFIFTTSTTLLSSGFIFIFTSSIPKFTLLLRSLAHSHIQYLSTPHSFSHPVPQYSPPHSHIQYLSTPLLILTFSTSVLPTSFPHPVPQYSPLILTSSTSVLPSSFSHSVPQYSPPHSHIQYLSTPHSFSHPEPQYSPPHSHIQYLSTPHLILTSSTSVLPSTGLLLILKRVLLKRSFCGRDEVRTRERFRRTLFIRTKHNMQMLGVIPFIKLQNNTQTTVKW